mmetsp:Transcript_58449/g.126456  ORF Transcript_58449/g.126456 Transcript_58449/m.126456 type:complete len:92 (-) Transcript_58449:126-401(-)
MFDIIFGVIVGLCIGALNGENVKPCLVDTFHIGQHHSKKAANAAAANAAPYVKQASEKAKAAASSASEKTRAAAAPYMAKAQDKYAQLRKK